MAEIEDKEWLELLAGSSAGSENTNSKRNADALRSAIKKFDAEELAQAHGLKKVMSRMTNEGLFLEPSDMSVSKKIIRFVKKIRLLGIFILGMIAGLIFPMQMATRGSDGPFIRLEFPHFLDEKIETELTFIDEDPLSKAKKITVSAISAGLSVTWEQKGRAIHLIIRGFKKRAPELIPLNSVLRLSNETQGNVSVMIKEQ